MIKSINNAKRNTLLVSTLLISLIALGGCTKKENEKPPTLTSDTTTNLTLDTEETEEVASESVTEQETFPFAIQNDNVQVLSSKLIETTGDSIKLYQVEVNSLGMGFDIPSNLCDESLYKNLQDTDTIDNKELFSKVLTTHLTPDNFELLCIDNYYIKSGCQIVSNEVFSQYTSSKPEDLEPLLFGAESVLQKDTEGNVLESSFLSSNTLEDGTMLIIFKKDFAPFLNNKDYIYQGTFTLILKDNKIGYLAFGERRYSEYDITSIAGDVSESLHYIN